MELVLKGQQPEALDAVARWWNTPVRQRKQVFRLYGGAGTGKTTVAKKFQDFARVHFMTLSGKAALVLRKKGCDGATTIHSAIYRVVEHQDGSVSFDLNLESEAIMNADLLVVDEVGMVDSTLGRDLEYFGKPILVLGDPNQLQPPNGEEAYFTSTGPDYLMTEVLRQAKESPILDLAYQALETGKLKAGKYGSCEVFSSKIRESKVQELMLGADQILCGRNATRAANNTFMRQWKGMEGSPHSHLPIVGDRLICLKNDRKKGTLNGEQFMVTELQDKDLGRISSFKADSIDMDNTFPHEFEVPYNFFEGTEKNIPRYELANFDQMAYAYLLTVHKAQGSQWDNVLILDESGVFKEQRRNHLYTAITRAAETVNII